MAQTFRIPDPDWTIEMRRSSYGEEIHPVDVRFRGRVVFTYNYIAETEGFLDYEWAEELAAAEFAAKLQKLLGEA